MKPLKPFRPSDDPDWRAPTMEQIKEAFKEGKRLADDLHKRMSKITIVHPCETIFRRK